eukprot:5149796-Prorocentrum_lima.AAC.1
MSAARFGAIGWHPTALPTRSGERRRTSGHASHEVPQPAGAISRTAPGGCSRLYAGPGNSRHAPQ